MRAHRIAPFRNSSMSWHGRGARLCRQELRQRLTPDASNWHVGFDFASAATRAFAPRKPRRRLIARSYPSTATTVVTHELTPSPFPYRYREAAGDQGIDARHAGSHAAIIPHLHWVQPRPCSARSEDVVAVPSARPDGPTLIDRLADAHYVALCVRHSGYLPRCEPLHDITREWRRLSLVTRSGKSRCGHH